MATIRSVRGFVSGRVQGVGFRYFVLRAAQAQGLAGYVTNLADGRVEFALQGNAAALERVLAQIRSGPAHARVTDLQVEDCAAEPGASGFAIR